MKKKNENEEYPWEDEFIESTVGSTDVFYQAAEETRAMGLPLWYRDKNCKENELIKEYPNGKKELYKTWWVNHKYYEEKIKDIN